MHLDPKPQENLLSQLSARIAATSRLPWVIEYSKVGGLLVGTTIKSPDREVVGKQGLLYGLSPGYLDHIDADTEFIAESRIDCEALYQALIAACGNDQEKANYLYEHARKQVMEEAGIIEKEERLHKA